MPAGRLQVLDSSPHVGHVHTLDFFVSYTAVDEEWASWIRGALELLSAAFPSNPWGVAEALVAQSLLRHVLAVLQRGENTRFNSNAFTLATEVGRYLAVREEPARVERVLELVLRAPRGADVDNFHLAQAWRTLAVAYGQLGRVDLSITAINRAITLTEPESELPPEFLLDAAGVMISAGELQTAEGWLHRAIALFQRSGGGVGPRDNLAGALSNLGLILRDTGRPGEAAELIESALQRRVRSVEAGLATTEQMRVLGHDLGNLGTVRSEQGLYEDARRLHLEAMRLHRLSVGEGHPSVARDWLNLAIAIAPLDRTADAAAAAIRGQHILAENYGADHPQAVSAGDLIARLRLAGAVSLERPEVPSAASLKRLLRRQLVDIARAHSLPTKRVRIKALLQTLTDEGWLDGSEAARAQATRRHLAVGARSTSSG